MKNLDRDALALTQRIVGLEAIAIERTEQRDLARNLAAALEAENAIINEDRENAARDMAVLFNENRQLRAALLRERP